MDGSGGASAVTAEPELPVASAAQSRRDEAGLHHREVGGSDNLRGSRQRREEKSGSFGSWWLRWTNEVEETKVTLSVWLGTRDNAWWGWQG